MNFRVRTDLACESLLHDAGDEKGIEHSTEAVDLFGISRVRITSEKAAKRLDKPVGCYVSIDCGRISSLDDGAMALLAELLSEELLSMTRSATGKRPDSEFSVFVAGLGNAELTADAIGPQTVGRLTATRHLREYEGRLYRQLGCSALSALAPGVLGQTGIETLELIRGAVEHVRPDLVIVIDALAARSCERLASTVQLSDVGITPGSGVANHRSPITRETIGVPVIAIGIPTVVDSATLVYDALRQAGIEKIDRALEQVLQSGRSFFVSPKESDVITHRVSALLAEAIGLAFTGGIG